MFAIAPDSIATMDPFLPACDLNDLPKKEADVVLEIEMQYLSYLVSRFYHLRKDSSDIISE